MLKAYVSLPIFLILSSLVANAAGEAVHDHAKFSAEDYVDMLELYILGRPVGTVATGQYPLRQHAANDCIEWARQRCQTAGVLTNATSLRAELGKCFDVIQVKDMQKDEFTSRTELFECRLLTPNQLYELMLYFSQRVPARVVETPLAKKFVFKFNASGMRVHNHLVKAISFKTSRRLIWSGIKVSNLFSATTYSRVPCPFDIKISLAKSGSTIYPRTENISIASDFIDVEIKPNFIEQDVDYVLIVETVKIHGKGPMHINTFDAVSSEIDGVQYISGHVPFKPSISEICFNEFTERDLDLLESEYPEI